MDPIRTCALMLVIGKAIFASMDPLVCLHRRCFSGLVRVSELIDVSKELVVTVVGVFLMTRNYDQGLVEQTLWVLAYKICLSE